MRSIVRRLVPALFAAILVGVTMPTYAAKPFVFTSIDVPGAIATYASGINDSGQIVGAFRQAAKKGRGFLRTAAGTFTPIDGPGAVVTVATKINAAGQIVGAFADAKGTYHGFLRSPAGAFTTIDAPGATATYAQGISDSGQIVGTFTKSNSAVASPDGGVQASLSRGFLRTPSGAVTTLSIPGAANTTDINSAGQIVGTFTDARGLPHGFLRAPNGDVRTIDVRAAGAAGTGRSGGTHAFGVNNGTEIVGFFGGVVEEHGFLRIPAGGFTNIDVPGATRTHALGINASGAVVGAFEDKGARYHGFVAAR